MWVSRKQWEESQKRWADAASDRREIWRKLGEVAELARAVKLGCAEARVGDDKELSALRQRVAELEKQVIPKVSISSIVVSSYERIFSDEPPQPPVTLAQKVELLLEHLKLRPRPEGKTPARLVKTGAK